MHLLKGLLLLGINFIRRIHVCSVEYENYLYKQGSRVSFQPHNNFQTCVIMEL